MSTHNFLFLNLQLSTFSRVSIMVASRKQRERKGQNNVCGIFYTVKKKFVFVKIINRDSDRAEQRLFVSEGHARLHPERCLSLTEEEETFPRTMSVIIICVKSTLRHHRLSPLLIHTQANTVCKEFQQTSAWRSSFSKFFFRFLLFSNSCSPSSVFTIRNACIPFLHQILTWLLLATFIILLLPPPFSLPSV